MSFFKEILETGLSNVVIDIRKTESKVTVIVTPKTDSKNDSLKALKPLIITYATAEEMDMNFMSVAFSPMQKTSELFDNVSEYEKTLAAAAKKTKEDADLKAAKAKPATKAETKPEPESKEKESTPKLDFDVAEDIPKEEADKIIQEAEKVIAENTPAEKTPEPAIEKPEELKTEQTVKQVPDEPVEEKPAPKIEEAQVIEEVKEEAPVRKIPSLFS